MQQTGPLPTRTRSRGPGSRPGQARLSTTSSATASPRLRWVPSAAPSRPGPEPSAHRTRYEEGARRGGPLLTGEKAGTGARPRRGPRGGKSRTGRRYAPDGVERVNPVLAREPGDLQAKPRQSRGRAARRTYRGAGTVVNVSSPSSSARRVRKRGQRSDNGRL